MGDKTYRIRALKWKGKKQTEPFGIGGYCAEVPFGCYSIGLHDDGLHCTYCFADDYDEGTLVSGAGVTLKSAKLAASQHWHQRIAAALEEVK